MPCQSSDQSDNITCSIHWIKIVNYWLTLSLQHFIFFPYAMPIVAPWYNNAHHTYTLRSHSDENCISVADAILNCHLKIENVFCVYDLDWDWDSVHIYTLWNLQFTKIKYKKASDRHKLKLVLRILAVISFRFGKNPYWLDEKHFIFCLCENSTFEFQV